MKQKLVVIGNGMAGIKAVEELLDRNPDLYDITVFGDEPHGNYNRIMLSPVLSGDKTMADIMINERSWYTEHGITLHAGSPVTSIDRQQRTVTAEDGTSASYDRLLIATGSSPFIIPVPGHDLPGVVAFRSIADVDAMAAAAAEYSRAVVIGGGLLGLEAAAGLLQRGMTVTVIHLMDCLMERQMDPVASALLKRSLEERSLTFAMPAETKAILGSERVRAVALADGSEVAADLVVMAVGIRPNIALAEEAGLHVERGIVVNDTMQTYDPRIYAVGECVQHRGQTYGLVAPLFDQSKVCANHLAEIGYARYAGSLTSTKLKVTGIDVFSAGDFSGGEGAEEIVFQDAAQGIYRKVVINDNQVQGALAYGDTSDGAWYFQLMRDGTDVSALREKLMFGHGGSGEAGLGGETGTAALPGDAEICGCNGVCKDDIVTAITAKNLFTLDDVRAHTKASSSCGSCSGLVEQILASTVGSGYAETPSVRPLCKCTAFSHDDVRRTIIAQNLKTIPAVMRFMDWETEDGCAKCRPALNYYLLCAWPGEHVDDAQSRFINERAHANIQKDGTYSVVPRMWGGMTNPKELRAIADVAERFDIPAVKLTGGQRIDLLGVKKEDLPAVWRDLNAAGMVSGHAYGKALRTVKTCVGSEWCRFGVQDSTSMGIDLEKMAWASWTPHKFKMAVSGCPRNCAEATIKDFGVVAVAEGWELHVGGNGGIRVRTTDLLAKVTTEDEVKEYAGAFMQLYREEAHYLERTAPWIERVGLGHVKERINEDAGGRRTLFERFLLSQKYAQSDPWAEGAEDPPEWTEIRPLAAAE
ncbi:MAG: NAD(P)/FAD-dependent oxidoreductase [Rhodospirillaceae bacterium]|nr:NAD(P)/FAD-dependent oxidoreductase [Rhodospirillaceae bacterium]MBT5837666.1 NAD(P)/FAD-dependent oxidoreductase [Rhodospirillaceae bacterium]MBT7233054.1 NAD(P)/FAD-dependent oxidoreductase [Rhodospirillaceae bacterium]